MRNTRLVINTYINPANMVFWNDKTEPDLAEIMETRRPSNTDAVRAAHRKSVSDRQLTGASNLTVKQSIVPIALVTTLFFLWGFAYGLLDTLNAKFQTSLNITAGMAGGLQGAYFGAYFKIGRASCRERVF